MKKKTYSENLQKNVLYDRTSDFVDQKCACKE